MDTTAKRSNSKPQVRAAPRDTWKANFPIKRTGPWTVRRTLHHAGCCISALSQAEFAPRPPVMRVFSLPNCGNSCQSGGNPLEAPATVCIFCNRVVRMPDCPRRASSKVPQAAFFTGPFSLLLGVRCITVAQTPNRNRNKKPHNYEGRFALRKTDFAQPTPTLRLLPPLPRSPAPCSLLLAPCSLLPPRRSAIVIR